MKEMPVVDAKAIAQSNHKVDLKKLEESEKMRNELRKQGFEPRGFHLATPMGREMSIFTKKSVNQ